VAPGPIVEHFNVIEDIRPGQIPVFVYSLTNAFFFSELKNNSATALSWQLPRLFMLGASYWPAEAVPVVTAVLAALRCKQSQQ
jgi:hypothetical protein